MSANYGIDKDTGAFVSKDPLIFNTDNVDFPDPFKPLYVVKVEEPIVSPEDLTKLINSSVIPKAIGEQRLQRMKEEEEKKKKTEDSNFGSLSLDDIFKGLSDTVLELLNNGKDFFSERADIYTEDRKYVYLGIIILILSVLILLV